MTVDEVKGQEDEGQQYSHTGKGAHDDVGL